ncbi:MAG: O-antigen ligase family protein, partial [Hyphomicrobiales bacterium]
MTGSWNFRVAAFVLVSCTVLGGGTRPGFLSDAVLQLVCVPLLCWMLWGLPGARLPRGGRLALVLCFAAACLPVLQLLPLPLRVWQSFPVRANEIAIAELGGASRAMLPISVAPGVTLQAFVSLIPPLTLFLAVLRLRAEERRSLSLLFVGLAVVNGFLGLAQLSQGPNSSLRFFDVTNPDDAVGFFANRNHFATYINCGIVFAIAWVLEFASGVRRDRARRPIVLIAALTGVVVLIAAAAMARSRAGLAGTALGLILGFALAVRTNRSGAGLSPGKTLGAAVVFSLLLALQFALYRVLDRFSADPLKDARADFARVTLEAIKAYFPFGSGVGTFTRVYPSFETPQHALLDTFVNRAHNDFVEFALEAGLLGGLLVAAIGLLAIWFAWAAWTRNDKAATSIDATLMRAASIALGIIAMHSALDYPLRTSAMMGVTA